MSTKRPFATRTEFYKISIFLAATAVFIFVGSSPAKLPLLLVPGGTRPPNAEREH